MVSGEMVRPMPQITPTIEIFTSYSFLQIIPSLGKPMRALRDTTSWTLLFSILHARQVRNSSSTYSEMIDYISIIILLVTEEFPLVFT